MKSMTIILSVFLCFVVVSSATEVKLGSLAEGAKCSGVGQCTEPFYCLDSEKDGAYCGKKPCKAAGECRIGHFCGGDGFCKSKNCDSDENCPGNLVCFTKIGKCGAKSTAGQYCESKDQCWTPYCVDSKCSNSASGEPRELDPEATPDEGSDGLSGGAIAGIVIGAILLLLLVLLCCFSAGLFGDLKKCCVPKGEDQ